MNIPFEKFRDEACKHFEHEPGLFDRMCTYTFNSGSDDNEDEDEELFDDDPFRVDVPCNEENCPFMKSDSE